MVKKHLSISVIVVNLNGESFIRRCLDSLLSQTFVDFETIVIDNGSADQSVNIIRSCYTTVRLVSLPDNIGFAAANNMAARQARGDWLALLNSDAFAEPDWLNQLWSATLVQPDIVSFACRALLDGDPHYLDGAGDVYHCSGKVWRAGHLDPNGPKWDRPREVFGPCAAAAFYRRDVYLEQNGFDEDFFCYCEDVDLAFRLRLSGFRCHYVPAAVIRHVGSATSGRASRLARYYGHRNLIWTFVKNMPGWLFWLCLPLHLVMNLVSIAIITAQGQGIVILRAKWDALAVLPQMLRKRRSIQRARRVKVSTIARQLTMNPMPMMRDLFPAKCDGRLSP